MRELWQLVDDGYNLGLGPIHKLDQRPPSPLPHDSINWALRLTQPPEPFTITVQQEPQTKGQKHAQLWERTVRYEAEQALEKQAAKLWSEYKAHHGFETVGELLDHVRNRSHFGKAPVHCHYNFRIGTRVHRHLWGEWWDRKPDLDNLIKSTQDPLTHSVFSDDFTVVTISAEKTGSPPPEAGVDILVMAARPRLKAACHNYR